MVLRSFCRIYFSVVAINQATNYKTFFTPARLPAAAAMDCQHPTIPGLFSSSDTRGKVALAGYRSLEKLL